MAECDAGTDNFLKDFYIPNYILVPDSEFEIVSSLPEHPVIVFINSKSGGQLGGDLLATYRDLLNKNQVFDLGEETPDKVLNKLYVNLEKLKQSGDILALEIEKRLRLIVAGGDGTASWLLGVVSDLKLSQIPPIATVPLGTGNNLPFAFGWGKKNPNTDRQSVKSFLDQVKKAKEMNIDSWHLLMRMKAPKEGPCEPVAPLELPHSLHAFHRVTDDNALNVKRFSLMSVESVVLQGKCSLCKQVVKAIPWAICPAQNKRRFEGMDAQVSYGFHSERKLHPERFKNQLINQTTYAMLGCTQGWFSASISQPTSRIEQLAKVKIMKSHGEWVDLNIPHSIRSIVCLNLPSFSGGLNPWGTPSKNRSQDKDFTPPFVDDGLIEVVGFRDAWHGLVLLAPNGHGTRLAQAHRIRFEFHKGAANHTYMRIDGEPWKQPLPVDDDTVVVEISHRGQVKMLAVEGCRSKSVEDPSSHGVHNHEDNGNDDDDGDEDWEERRKFGAADTFKIPDEADIAHFS
ncbi:hypothetical protein Sjap_003561 [Stephania japonica]|uniref:Diacylglycerol kinase n=1 Tax=Stephania japonica TaxID=461633 RepID=A0AAP0KP04_9MAGN